MTEKPWLLVLGANSDIAISISKYFAQNGFNLYLASRNLDRCKKNASDIRKIFNVDVEALKFDACNYDSHEIFFSNLKTKPHGVIVAFGVMNDQQLSQNNFHLAQDMIDTNYKGAVSILETVSVYFQNQKSGFIVGISSVAGERGRKSNYIYGSTKAAFTTYLSGLRHRLKRQNILVLTVIPGFVNTKMTSNFTLPKTITAQPDQVAEAVYNAIKNKKDIIYVKPIWRLIMLIIKLLPNFIFHKTKL